MTTQSDTSFYGHPAGLKTLFVTEMWERMSYYGMRMMLVLFMTATLQEGGLGLTVASATAIYGLYTGSVYFMGLPGGWIADRLIGGQRAVWYGGIIIMMGHIVLAIPNDKTFFVGLILVVLGTGLLKPNIGALVGQLYSEKDKRRDSGYALYYMGINLGSVIGYTVCGYLMEDDGFGWHWAFGAAAVGMGLGLIQYKRTLNNLNSVGAAPESPLTAKGQKLSWSFIWATLIAITLIAILAISGNISIDAVQIAEYVSYGFIGLFICYYACIFIFGNLTSNEMKRLLALFLICVASAFFWSGFEQAGSSMNLFARDLTDRTTGFSLLQEIPTGWFQSLNSVFIVLLSPFFAALWINLGKRLVSPSYGIKCAVGLLIMASGFIVMFFAAQIAASGLKVAPYWLVTTYFLHTVGELCLSPVALSAVSKLSPRRFAGQMMGVFVLTYSIGNIIAGRLAGSYNPDDVSTLSSLYSQIATFSVGVAIVILLFAFKSRIWEALPEEDGEKDDKPKNTAATTA